MTTEICAHGRQRHEAAGTAGDDPGARRRGGRGYAGELVWEFSKTFRAVEKRSHHWAAISARAVLAMECTRPGCTSYARSTPQGEGGARVGPGGLARTPWRFIVEPAPVAGFQIWSARRGGGESPIPSPGSRSRRQTQRCSRLSGAEDAKAASAELDHRESAARSAGRSRSGSSTSGRLRAGSPSDLEAQKPC